MKFLKQSLIVLLSLIILVVISYFAFIFILPKIVDLDVCKKNIEEQVKLRTGFSMSIEKITVKPDFSPYLSIDLHHLKLNYPNGKNFLKVRDANVQIDLPSLFIKKIKLKKIRLVRPVLSTALYSDCKTSFERDFKLKPIDSFDKYAFKLVDNIPVVYLDNYKLKIYDHAFSEPFIIEGDKLQLSDFKPNESVHLTTTGSVIQGKHSFIKYDVDLNTYLTKSDGNIFKVDPFKYLKEFSVSTNVYAHLNIKNTQNSPKIIGDATLSNTDLVVSGIPLIGNSINLAFTGNSVSINANVQTSFNNRAKLEGKYAFGLQKKLELKVKAADASLANLHKLANAILGSLNIKNKFGNYNVSGLADMDFYITTDFKTIKSSGSSKIQNASISCKEFPFKISKITSFISFDNNTVQILDTTAYVDSMPLLVKGIIHQDTSANVSVKAQALPLKHVLALIPSNFLFPDIDVNSGSLTFSANLRGKITNMIVALNASIQDLSMLFAKNNKYKAKSIEVTSEGNVKSRGCNITVVGSEVNIKNLISPISSKKIQLKVQGKDIDILSSTISWQDSHVITSGKILDYLGKKNFDIVYKGALSSNNLYRQLGQNFKLKASAKGSLPINGKISGSFDDIKVESQISADKSNYLSYLVVKELVNQHSILNLEAKYKNDKLQLDEIALYKQSYSSRNSATLKNNLINAEKILSVTGQIEGLSNPNLKEILINIPKSLTASISTFPGSEVSVKSDLKLSGNMNSPAVVGILDLNYLIIPEYSLKAENLSLLFSKNNLKIMAPNIQVKNSKFNIEANAIPILGKNIIVKDVNFNSQYFNLSEIAGAFSSFSNSNIAPGFTLPIQVLSGHSYINKFVATGVQASNVNANFTIANNLLRIRKMTASSYNGSVWGDIDYNFLYAKTSVRVAGKNLDAAPAVKALTGLDDNILGKLDFGLNSTMSGYSRQQQLSSIVGKAQIVIHNGQLGSLGKFEHFLYAQNLISQSIMRATVNVITQAVASKDTGRFKYLESKVTFSDGYVNINSVESSGPNMSLKMSGRMNLLNNWADLNILGTVSSDVVSVMGPLGELSISNIASNIPKLSSVNVSLPNIFFNKFNMKVDKSVIAQIPPLTPATMLKTRHFNVSIKGNVNSVKSVKSFKWLSIGDPSENQQIQSPARNQQQNGSQYQKLERVYDSEPSGAEPYSNPKSQDLPSFLDKLPSTIH